MGTLARIVRHPVKAVGREELGSTRLAPGRWVPGDRLWAVAHEASKFAAAPEGWVNKMNFLRGVTGPALMAATARLDEGSGRIALDHPEQGPLEIDPTAPEDEARFLSWIAPLWPEDKPRPRALVRAPGTALTDVPDPWVSINGLSSLMALGQRVGQPLDPHRFRGNLWVEGLGPWEEFEWVGREIRVGKARLAVRQRITRCKATMANPQTGRRDADTLGALDTGWGHTDFGVYAEVIEGGDIALGDAVALA